MANPKLLQELIRRALPKKDLTPKRSSKTTLKGFSKDQERDIMEELDAIQKNAGKAKQRIKKEHENQLRNLKK